MATPWNRLQALSCEHALRIYVAGRKGVPAHIRRGYCRPGTSVPGDIAENVDILGRGDDAELKARVLWYMDYFPDIFDACSRRNWRVAA
jgi:hypothetical protein